MKILTTAPPLGLAVAVAATLAACGSSSTPTATVTAPARTTSSAAAAPTSTSSSSSSTSSSSSRSASTTSASTSTATSTSTTASATSTTRTQTGPAFVGTNPSSGAAVGKDLSAAIAALSRRGYVPVATDTYSAGNTLRVLIGRRPGSASEHAFFFDQTIYLGTDASTPSEQITLVDANDTEVTLSYAIYRPGATTASGERSVRFVLDMGQLSAMDPLPSVAQRR